MVKKDIGELGAVVVLEADIGLAKLVGFREVGTDLHGNFGKHCGFHASLKGLAVE